MHSETALSPRPQLETLESRTLLSVTYHGGPLLAHVQIEGIYLGAAWQNDPTLAQQRQTIDQFLAHLTNSQYLDMLGEYGVGRGGYLGSVVDASAVFANNVVPDAQIQSTLANLIAGGSVAAPDANRLYVIFTAPDVHVTIGQDNSVTTFLGYHGSAQLGRSQNAYYAMIPNPIGNANAQGLDTIQQMTAVLTHEVAEAVTNPNGRSGWFDDYSGQEIGDLANGVYGMMDNYVVQAEWSQAANGDVIPASAQPISDLFLFANQLTNSQQYQDALIEKAFGDYLGREATPRELAAWEAALSNGVGDETLAATLVSSQEFYSAAGGSDAAWVDALYRSVLGRAADAGGRQGFLNALAGGVTRADIANAFTFSREHEAEVVMNDYQQYLHRGASQAEIDGWTSALQSGLRSESLIAEFVGSGEYIARSYDIARVWERNVYEDILQQAPPANSPFLG